MLRLGYRLNKATLGIIVEAGRGDLVMIPEGSDVEVLSEPLRVSGFIHIRWNTLLMQVFAEDLRARGEYIDRPLHALCSHDLGSLRGG